MTAELSVETTDIPGLLVVRLPLHEDARGWFKENWQRAKMTALGLPDFGPVQHSVAYNARRGVTRGVHTEPWDKFISVAQGRIFGAWVDMREGDSFGTVFTIEADPSVAVFVPRGVGNSYQVLEDNTTYSYLVNDHWRAGLAYPALNLADPTVAIPWPIPLAECEISDKDLSTPMLADVEPMKPKKTLIIGALGQLGRALTAAFPDADLVDLPNAVVEKVARRDVPAPVVEEVAQRPSRDQVTDAGTQVEPLDVTDQAQVAAFPWNDYALVLNAAAYTAVDAAETPDGRRTAWAANARAPATLARLAAEHRFTLVHYSTEYVFDGTLDPHAEDEPLSPLGVYAQTKAAGDIAVAAAPRHYVLRTSWVIGDGKNFVRTMQQLATTGVSPSVVDDQVGRLTFTDELARATVHLVNSDAAYGTYNISNGGAPMSWCEIAQEVFALSGRAREDVTPVSTDAFYTGQEGLSPRPLRSIMDLSKIEETGFVPEDALPALQRYLS
jgi:dTDP-4-dehydrorhamnose reductase